MSINPQKTIVINPNRSKCKRCPKCNGRLIRFGGQEWNGKAGLSLSFTVGRVCKRCEVFYINPKFKECKIIFHKIGASQNANIGTD